MVKKLVSRVEFARLAGVSAAAVTKACNNGLRAAVVGKRIDLNHPDTTKYLKKKTAPVATGLDGLYPEAVGMCQESGRYSITFLQKQLRIGYERAKKIIGMMRTAGLIPEPDDTAATVATVVKPLRAPHVRGTEAKKATRKDVALAAATERLENPHTDPDHEIPEDLRAFADFTLRELVIRFGTDIAFLDWLKALKAIEDVHEKRLKNAEKEGTLINRDLVKRSIVDTFDGAHQRMLTDGAKTISVRAFACIQAGEDLQALEDLITDQLGSFIRPTKAKIARVLRNA